MKIKITVFFALCLLIISCARLEENVLVPSNEYLFSVSAELPAIEQESESKGYLGSFVSASWTQNDKVSVINLTKGKILGGYLTADKTDKKSTFSGTVTGTIEQGDKIALFYPSFENSSETDFGSRQISLDEQSKASKVPLVTYTYFTATSDNGTFTNLNLSFYYILSFFKLNLSNLPANATVSKITLRNMPDKFTVSINNDGSDFTIGTDEEKSAKEKIVLTGAYTTSEFGEVSTSFGIMPSTECTTRQVVVTVDGQGEFCSPIPSEKLVSHKYYNRSASQFEQISLAGKEAYGIYNVETSSTIDSYDEFSSSLITGNEGDESDFTLLNTSSSRYWTIKGIPEDATEGTSFTARIYTYGVDFPTNTVLENAKIRLVEPDGNFSKLWVKAGNNVFIVRK